MADFSEWGAERSGPRIFEEDEQKRMLANLSAQHTLAQTQLIPFTAAHLQAQTAHAQAQAETMQEEIASQRAMRAAYLASQGAPQPQVPSTLATPEMARAFPAARLAGVAQQEGLSVAPGAQTAALAAPRNPLQPLIDSQMAFYGAARSAGRLKEANVAVDNLRQLYQTDTQMRSNEATQRYRELQANKLKIDEAVGYLDGVGSQADLNAATRAYVQEHGEPPPWFGQQYAPGFSEAWQRRVLTAKERLDADFKEWQQTDKENYQRRRLSQHDVENDLRRRRLEETARRTDVLARGGGANRGSASPEQVKQTLSLLTREVPGIADSLGAAEELAGIVKLQQRPGEDWTAATRRVIQEKRAAGELTTTNPNFGNPVARLARGMTPATAMPLPDDRRTLRKGAHYITDKGVAVYLGDGQFRGAEPPRGNAVPRAVGGAVLRALPGMGQSPDFEDEED